MTSVPLPESIATAINAIFIEDTRYAGTECYRAARTLEDIARRALAGAITASQADMMIEMARMVTREVVIAAIGRSTTDRENQINAAIDALKALIVGVAKSVL
jgi:hypothetical protein